MKQLAYLSLLIGLLGSSLSFAQLTFTNAATGQQAGTLSSCDPGIKLQASGGGLPQGQSVTAYVITPNPITESCGANGIPNGTSAAFIVSGLQTVNTDLSVTAQQLLTAAGACSSEKVGTGFLCVYDKDNKKTAVRFDFDTRATEIGASLSVGSQRVIVTASDNKSKNDYLVCYGKDTDGAEAKLKALTAGQNNCGDLGDKGTARGASPLKITGLENGQKYWFSISVNPNSGTTSKWVGPLSETPIESFGFTAVYDGAGNPVSWNCSQSNVPPVGGFLFALVLCWIFLRRRHCERSEAIHGLPRWLCLAMTMLMANVLFADLGQVNLGILGTPYRPALDLSTKPDGSQITPFYSCMYEDKLAPLMGLEVDVHLVDGFGSLQLGIGTQYTFVNGSASKSKTACDRSNDSVRLHMLHLRPQLTYVLDPWVDYFPLVPYLRVGLVGVGYIFQYQDGWDQENKDGPGKNMGMVFGWSAAAGLMLSLKFLEPGAAARAVSNGVYDNIYLKAEAAYMPINNFYSQGMDFSPAWPQANKNFPIFLNFGLVFEFN